MKAIVAYEPSQFIFPPGRLPAAIKNAADGTVINPGIEVSLDEFKNLTRMPIQLVYRDYVPDKPDSCRHRNGAGSRWSMARPSSIS